MSEVKLDQSIYSGATLESQKRVAAMTRTAPEQSPFFEDPKYTQCVVENRTQFSFKLESPAEVTNISFVKGPCSMPPFSQMDFSVLQGQDGNNPAKVIFTLTANLSNNAKFQAKLGFQKTDTSRSVGITDPSDATKPELGWGNELHKSVNAYTTAKATDCVGEFGFKFNMIACPGALSTFVIDQVGDPDASKATPSVDLKDPLDTLDMLEGEQRLMSEMRIPLALKIKDQVDLVQCLFQNRSQFPFELKNAVLKAGNFIKAPTPVTPYSVMEFVVRGEPFEGGLLFEGHLDLKHSLHVAIGFERPKDKPVQVGIAESAALLAKLSTGVATTSTDNHKSEVSTGGQYSFHFQMAATAGRVALFVVDLIPWAKSTVAPSTSGGAVDRRRNKKH